MKESTRVPLRVRAGFSVEGSCVFNGVYLDPKKPTFLRIYMGVDQNYGALPAP